MSGDVLVDFRPATEHGVLVGQPISDHPASGYGIGNLPHAVAQPVAVPGSATTARPGLVPSAQGGGYGSGTVIGVPMDMAAPGLAPEDSDAWEDRWFSWLDPVIEPRQDLDSNPIRGRSERSRLLDGLYSLPEERGYPDYCCSAWLSALLCFWPVGLCAVFLSIQTAEANSVGDRRTARRYSRMTFLFTMTSIALGFFL